MWGRTPINLSQFGWPRHIYRYQLVSRRHIFWARQITLKIKLTRGVTFCVSDLFHEENVQLVAKSFMSYHFILKLSPFIVVNNFLWFIGV